MRAEACSPHGKDVAAWAQVETGCWNRLVRAREVPKTPSDACVTGQVDCRQSSTPGKRDPSVWFTVSCKPALLVAWV
jgi:hypothetical protein